MSPPRRGEIYLVNFDPTIGAEIKKIRPAVIIQNDVSNQYSPITIIAAITSRINEPPYPTEVILDKEQSGLHKRSAILLNQVRSVDRSRLLKRIGRVAPDTMEQVDAALMISLALVDD